ncbi:MAG TPA: hypothetical protein VKZ41_12645 [Gemmatimonadales bacterium]|nr:hypothetical protein [Gemmatimonadales bacterium]
MTPRWAALSAVLALFVVASVPADAQSTPPRPRSTADSAAVLPPVTTQAERQMTFSVGDAPNCSEKGKFYKVTLRVYNVLAQLVAVPVLKDNDTRRDDDKPLENVLLSCDEYTAYWDGTNVSTSQVAAPGMYLYKLEVDGRPVQVKRVTIKK